MARRPRHRVGDKVVIDGGVMDFRIADTFTDSLARLSGEQQKAGKIAAFDLQLNPASPARISEFFHLTKLCPCD